MPSGQTRYFDKISPLNSTTMRALLAVLHPAGPFAGFDATVTGPEEITVSPGDLVFPSGVVFSQPAPLTIDFANPVVPATFTLAWRHSDQGVFGGADAELVLLLGKQEVVEDGVPIAFIKHPGVGVLDQGMVVPTPRLKIPEVLEDVARRAPIILHPPFPGAINVAIPGEATISGAAAEDGDVTYTAVNPAQVPQVRHVVSGLNTPISVVVLGVMITVNLATNGSGVATSTAAQVVSAVSSSTAAAAVITPRSGGTGLGTAGAAGYTPLSDGLPASGTNVGVTVAYARAVQKSVLRFSVGSGATGAETHVLLFRFPATALPPRRFTLSLNNSALSSISLLLRDTLGEAVALTPSVTGPTSGWSTAVFEVASGGTFAEGESWFLQIKFSGQATAVAQLAEIIVTHDGVAVV